jgi:hypothetical protein
MNKYQEALNELKSWSTTSSIPIGADKHFVYEQVHILQELVDRYSESLKLLDWAHQEMYPLVTLLEKDSNIGRSVAIKIAEFKREIDWSDKNE